MSDPHSSPSRRPARVSSNPRDASPPVPAPPQAAIDSLTARLRDNLPFILLGGAFVAGAWAASLYHVRVFASPYPLWIVLALNGVVAAVAGTAGMFTVDTDVPIDDRPDLVRVPRVEWESMVQRSRRTDPTTPSRTAGLAVRSLDRRRAAVAAVAAARLRETVPPTPRPSVPFGPAPAPEPDASALRREMGRFELHGIAEAAISTGEHLGGDRLRSLLSGSADDLTHIAKLLGTPRRPGEAPSALLIRLLRMPTAREGIAPDRFTEDDAERLAAKLSALIRAPARPPTAGNTAAEIRAVTDEFESLLEELEPRKPAPAKPDPVARSKDSA